MKVVVLFDNLGPYHIARLRVTEKLCQLQVIEVKARSSEYDWDGKAAIGFPKVTIVEDQSKQANPTRRIVEGIEFSLNNFQPRVVLVPGWSSVAAFASIRWCLRNQVPIVAMSESTACDDVRRPWREWIKKKVVRLYSAALVGGQPHTEYINSLGMTSDKIFKGYDAVDNKYFQQSIVKIQHQDEIYRSKYQLPKKYFLASARFIEKKNLSRLIHAYERYYQISARQNDKPWKLILLGDGKLRPHLENQVQKSGLSDQVLIPGFKQYDELPVYYGLAGAFIHASTVEQWGLVVNEAMASSLPVIVSSRCGCSADLVIDGQNGYTFNPFSIEELASLMVKMSELPEIDRQNLGFKSQEIISNWGPEAFAQGMIQAVHVATSNPVPKAGLLDSILLKALINL